MAFVGVGCGAVRPQPCYSVRAAERTCAIVVPVPAKTRRVSVVCLARKQDDEDAQSMFRGPLAPSSYSEDAKQDAKDRLDRTREDSAGSESLLLPEDEPVFELQDKGLEAMLTSAESRRELRRARRESRRAKTAKSEDGSRSATSEDPDSESPNDNATDDEELRGQDVVLSPEEADDPVKRLTRRFKMSRDELMMKVEADPDFMFQAEIAKDDTYDMTAAIIGAGQPREVGGGNTVYILPYLQNGHLIGLLTILLMTFAYNPGLPLTNLPDEFRGALARGLLVTFVVNSCLVLAVPREAALRRQPTAFWALKVFLLGGLALNELQTNIRPVKQTNFISGADKNKLQKALKSRDLPTMPADVSSSLPLSPPAAQPLKEKQSDQTPSLPASKAKNNSKQQRKRKSKKG
ncbi:hypothetical protein FVE85_6106 [Porphyridium purpureum]|uniref:Uncharacterized protein n=1 Tax=Porphyridium purpureum TaxID=35688 RepID=A0A5J4Z3V4_PORPP|nr:hypothetical protein FVE85_6106 [Porphyridium purpureum]|eukprot:POR6182..scf295_1